MKNAIPKRNRAWMIGVAAAAMACAAGPASADPFAFIAGDLVVSVEGNGSNTAAGGASATGNTGANADAYLDNQAAPLTLFEFSTTGTNQSPVATLELPTASSGGNSAISGEYGSSSEATLQLTGDGHALTIAGYAINPTAYNSASDLNGAGTALAQSCSLSVVSACAGVPQVARVIAVVGADGSVNTSTVISNIANENNPRSVYSANGTSFYISGQGTGNTGDTTGGVFYIPSLGPTQNPIPITGQDAPQTNVSQDTREVQINNNVLDVSVDTKAGKNAARDFVGTLGSPPATSLFQSGAGPTMLPGFGNSGGTGKETITAITSNGVNSSGQQINLSPQNFFFANSTTLYVADDGAPKNDSVGTTAPGSSLGDGGLQKWSLVSGVWTLDYTLAAGLGLVANSNAHGSSGLYGLTGEDVTIGGISEVELFATNYTLSDLDPTFLYGIDDILSDTNNPSSDGSFVELAAAPADTTFKGIAFAPIPVPEPLTLSYLGAGLVTLVLMRRRNTLKS